jgi:hypothetical protein
MTKGFCGNNNSFAPDGASICFGIEFPQLALRAAFLRRCAAKTVKPNTFLLIAGAASGAESASPECPHCFED